MFCTKTAKTTHLEQQIREIQKSMKDPDFEINLQQKYFL